MSIDVIGTGLGENGLPPAYARILDAADIIAGGGRMLEMVNGVALRAGRIAISRDIDMFCRDVLKFHEAGKRVVVLADGDPLFFSVGNSLAARAGNFKSDLRFWPNVSSLQGAAAALGIAWENVKTVSLHGRADRGALWHALSECGISCTQVCVLTSGGTTPAEIARELLERGVKNCEAAIIEMLGTDSQKTGIWSVEDLASAENEFEPLNVLMLRMKEPRHPVLGAPDSAYHSDGGLITKRSARAAALAELRLRPGDVLWDVGAGSGSVGIEASCLVRHGKVFSIERDERRAEDIAANRAAHGAWFLEIVRGSSPDACEALPCPDRIFVGGGLSGEREAALASLRYLSGRLRPGGRLVVACLLLGSLECVRHFLEQSGWLFEIRMVQVAETVPLAGDCRFRSTAQLWLISAEKPRD